MRRFSRHAGPHALALGAIAGPQDRHRSREQHCEERRLCERNKAHAPEKRRIAVMQQATVWQGEWLVLRVQHADLRQRLRVRGSKREVLHVGRDATRIGDDHRHTHVGDAGREVDQRGLRRCGRRIGDRSVDACVQLAGCRRPAAQLTRDHVRIPYVRSEERQQPDRNEDDRRAPFHPRRMTSVPRYSRSASGTSTLPSSRW